MFFDGFSFIEFILYENVVSLGLVLFFMLFMALRKSLKITKLLCSILLIILIAFRMASDSAEKIEHSFGGLYARFVFWNISL